MFSILPGACPPSFVRRKSFIMNPFPPFCGRFALAVALICCTSHPARAALYVDNLGANGAYTTITAAITASAPGDTIFVFPGSYGNYGASINHDLIINGSGKDNNNGTPLSYTLWESNALIGLTITNSNVSINNIYISCNYPNIDATITTIRLTNSTLSLDGVAIYAANTYQYPYNRNSMCVQLDAQSDLIARNSSFKRHDNNGGQNLFGGDIDLNSCILYRGYNGSLVNGVSRLVSANTVFTSTVGVTQTSRNDLYLGQAIGNSIQSSYRYCATTGSVNDSSGTNLHITTSAYDTNYFPTSGSPLINAGDPGQYGDLDGSRLDIGAYGGLDPYNSAGANWYPRTAFFDVMYGTVFPGQPLPITADGRIGPAWYYQNNSLLMQSGKAAQPQPEVQPRVGTTK